MATPTLATCQTDQGAISMTTTQRPLRKIATTILFGAVLGVSTHNASAGNSWTSTNFGTQCTQSYSSPVPGQPGWTSCGMPDPSIKGFSSPSGTGAYEAATIYDWNSSGLGIVNSGENANQTGPHALDNYGNKDAIVFGFSNGAVNLTTVTLGWNGTDNYTNTNGVIYNDSDMSVFAWTGAAVDPTTLATFGPASAGWTLIGDYANVGVGSNVQSVASSIYSSYWLVTTTGMGSASSSDAFKVLALAGQGCALTISGNACVPGGGGGNPGTSVPEPGSLALLMAGFAGMVAVRRRKQE
jgi:hypothetical protein